MESVRSRLRSRSAGPSQLSPVPTVPAARTRSGSKRKRSPAKSKEPRLRRRRSSGRSIPCQVTTPTSQVSTAVSNVSVGAHSADNITTAASGTFAGAQSVSYITATSENQGQAATSSSFSRAQSANTVVSNDILPNIQNSNETLVINKDALSDLISAEVSKRMGSLVENAQSNRVNATQGNNMEPHFDSCVNSLPTTLASGPTDQGHMHLPTHLSNAPNNQPTPHALEQAVSTLLSVPGEKNMPLINAMKFDLPIDTAISDKLKKQIISREYIELGCLLSPDIDNDMKLNVSVGSNGPAIVLNSVRKAKPILNINGWISAMHIYGSVYLKAYPNEVAPFFQYLEFVTKMAKKLGFYWKQYDEAFRRARQYADISWGTVLVNQYMSCFTASVSGSTFRQSGTDSRFSFGSDNSFRRNTRQGETFIPKPFCFALHREGACKKSNCKWEHTCFSCKGNHSILRCNKSSGNNPNISQHKAK